MIDYRRIELAGSVRPRAATSTIPVVFHVGVDPVRAGFVPSLNRPGGNVTGVTFFAAALGQKRLGLLREFDQFFRSTRHHLSDRVSANTVYFILGIVGHSQRSNKV
jgi:ABC transporter substrate binding protein